LLTYILEVLKVDPAMRQIILQKLLDNEDSGDDSSSVELAIKSRICDLQDSEDLYDQWQNKNKDKRKKPAKVTTSNKNGAHYLKNFFL